MTERLAPQPGEWIDRGNPIRFRFEGQSFTGFAGDVLASALWANGVRMTGRSFKYHRPRGIYSLANHDANFLVESATRTNIRGDSCPLTEDLDVQVVNTWGNLERDWLNIIEKFARFLPVGFYYKAFHTPRRLFPLHENQMRKAAGLGRVDLRWTSRHTPKDYAFCDLLVVGAGPAGLSAALAAADQGADVMVVDEMVRHGGSLNWQWAGDPSGREQLESLVQRTSHHQNIRMRMGTQAAGCYADRWIALVDPLRLTKLRTKALLFASGCIEQPAVFQNNDLPGVILGSAAQRLIHQYAVRPFRQAVVLAANLDGYRLAVDLHESGVDVRAVVDLTAERTGDEVAAVHKRRIRVLSNCGICEALAARRKHGVAGAKVAPLNKIGELDVSNSELIRCDGIAVSVGWAPTSDLLYQAGARFTYDKHLEQLVPEHLPNGIFVAGRVRGVYTLDDQIADGAHAGERASAHLGYAAGDAPQPSPSGKPYSHPYPIFAHKGKKNFVDMDEDLHLADFINAHQEGYNNVELLKRYSTVGMGPSQGKLSNQNAIRILARLNGATVNETGTTTARPFHQPVSIEHLAGRRFHPERRTPLHNWHKNHRALFTRVGGGWLRPEYYESDLNSREASIVAEARHVRSAVGIIDLGTLGKIHVAGPDAAELLQRVYTGSFKRQRVGTLGYGLACDESGFVIEDGVVARRGEDSFYLSATTSGSAHFFRELQRWALVWKLDVILVDLTGQYTAMNLAGPAAREVLAAVCGADLSTEAFPFCAVREADVAGQRALIMRVGFVGELGYEIHLPASRGETVWNALVEAGRQAGVQPFGVEAQRLLRLEKGFHIIGQDTDALTTPFHLGMEKVTHKKKKFFVGRRSLQAIEKQPLDRLLVGIQFDPNYSGPFPQECCLVIEDSEIVGRVTSIAPHTTLDRAIGLAFVSPQWSTPGTGLKIRTEGGAIGSCRVAETPFYDPDNLRQKH